MTPDPETLAVATRAVMTRFGCQTTDLEWCRTHTGATWTINGVCAHAKEAALAALQVLPDQAGVVRRLRAALLEAADDIEEWGAYASTYHQLKWDLAGDVKRARDAATKEAPKTLAAIATAVADHRPVTPHTNRTIHNPGVHKPHLDDGVLYCGWAGDGGIYQGCGEAWPCSAMRTR